MIDPTRPPIRTVALAPMERASIKDNLKRIPSSKSLLIGLVILLGSVAAVVVHKTIGF